MQVAGISVSGQIGTLTITANALVDDLALDPEPRRNHHLTTKRHRYRVPSNSAFGTLHSGLSTSMLAERRGFSVLAWHGLDEGGEV